MIADIKKYTFLVHHSDYSGLLNSLRDIGVVHIAEKRKLDETSVIGDELKSLRRYKEAIRRLKVMVPDEAPAGDTIESDSALSEFESLLAEIEEAGNQLERLKSEAEKSKPWGIFNANDINKIKDAGWNISLFSCAEKRFDAQWKEEYNIEVINRIKGRLYFAIIHKEEERIDIAAEQEIIPERTINIIEKEQEVIRQKIDNAKSSIAGNASLWITSLNKGTDNLISRIEYSSTAEQADRYADNNLYVLEGWVPVSDESKLQDLLQKTDCYAFTSEPDPEEKVPVILRNNSFASLFEVISKLFSLPYYKELDLTPFFAPFFMLFFGFCFGDAGYGLVFLLGGFFIKKKVKKEFRPIITLAQYFGIAAIIMGLVSGTFFGMNLIDSGYTITEESVIKMKKAGLPENTIIGLDQLKGQSFESRQDFSEGVIDIIGQNNYSRNKAIILRNAESDMPFLSSVRHLMLDSQSMFYLALIVGAFQIIFGMFIKIFNVARQKGFRYSLSTIGWVMLIFTFIVFKGGGMLGIVNEQKMRFLFLALLSLSGILIFLFNNPDKKIYVRLGLGLWDSYGMITGIFGDLLSYIRLFALGVSSSILGFVFNDISLRLLSVDYIGWLLCLILLVVGHSINIALSTLGSFVHPMRLTFVEFYKNAGFTGGGIEYKPFK